MTARMFLPVLALLALALAPRDEVQALDGAALYAENCARCHAMDARGRGPDAVLFLTPPANLRAAVKRQSPALFAQRVMQGGRQPLELDLLALRAHASDTEALVGYLQRIPTIDWPAADAGQRLFTDRCALCHGPFGRAATKAERPPGVRQPRDLGDPTFQRSASDEDMITAVRHGRAGMPALTPRLTEQDAQHAVVFVRLLSPGYETYTRYCAPCHGDHGVGTGSFGESYAAPTVIFDRAYVSGRDPEALRASAWHMLSDHRPSMPHFRARLKEEEARAIVDYLRKLGN